jgi:hypothetical protein
MRLLSGGAFNSLAVYTSKEYESFLRIHILWWSMTAKDVNPPFGGVFNSLAV